MMKLTIIIKQVGENQIVIDMVPDNTKGTDMERYVSRLLDKELQTLSESVMKKLGGGIMGVGDNAAKLRHIADSKD